MTNPRDTGRYDAFNDEYVDQQVRIDFAWGNIPIQPNDDRGEATLDPTLDSHEIAVSGWSSFPEFTPNTGFDLIMPNLIGINTDEAQTILNGLGLVPNAGYVTAGATSLNNNSVKTQSIPAGTVVEPGTTVVLEVYQYIAVPVNYNISGIRKQWGAESNLDYNMFYMFLQGQNHNLANGNTINITGSDVDAYNKNGWIVIDAVNDNTFNTGGTQVTIFWNGVISETANGAGGTYAKV